MVVLHYAVMLLATMNGLNSYEIQPCMDDLHIFNNHYNHQFVNNQGYAGGYEMKLVITEKPSVAQSIARVIGANK